MKFIFRYCVYPHDGGFYLRFCLFFIFDAFIFSSLGRRRYNSHKEGLEQSTSCSQADGNVIFK